MEKIKVLIKGAGDIASGIAYKLHRCNFSVIMTELPFPIAIRQNVSFASAIFKGFHTIEGVKAVRAEKQGDITNILKDGHIALFVDPKAEIVSKLQPDVVVDSILAKNLGTHISDAPIVIGLGPGFQAKVDVDYVIETMRGHNLGKVIMNGSALSNTGVPGNISGHTKDRVIRAPKNGLFKPVRNIGDIVAKSEIIGYIDDKDVIAPLTGVIRGLIYKNCQCYKNMKIGDIDPRGEVQYCDIISDKSRAVSGGVLEAILINKKLWTLKKQEINM